MTITQDDFKKVWASTSSVPKYTFSDTDYQNGWEFVGNLPPTRAMWDELQRKNDEKMQFLQENGSMCFNSVADMKLSNLDTGQTALTKGYYSVNDGGSSIYAIRTKTQSDVEDGGSIIFLDNGNVAEKIIYNKLDYTNEGVFRFGYMNENADGYCNGMATDGESYYIGYYSLSGNSNLKKFDKNGSVIATYQGTTEHFNGLTWNSKNTTLYAATDNTHVATYDSLLNILNSYNLGTGGLGIIGTGETLAFVTYDPVADKLYVGKKTGEKPIAGKIYEVTFDFSAAVEICDIPTVYTQSIQGCAIYAGQLYLVTNYPNLLIEYTLQGHQINYAKFDDVMDGTYLGEVEAVIVTPTEILIAAAKITLGNYYYTEVFSLRGKADTIEHYAPVMGNGNTLVIAQYVDATSTVGYSDGSQSAPWLSLNECLLHTGRKIRYNIYCINAHPIYDVLSATGYAPSGNYNITYSGLVPSNAFRFYKSDVYFTLNTEETVRVNVENCNALINATNAIPANVTITARNSNVRITGNVDHIYNHASLINSNGTATTIEDTEGGISITQGNGRTGYLKTSFATAGTLKVGAKVNASFAWSAIVSIMSTRTRGFNRVFLVNGYGVGGSARTSVYMFPTDDTSGGITASVDASNDAVNFTIGNTNNYDIVATTTILGTTNETDIDSIYMEFTAN